MQSYMRFLVSIIFIGVAQSHPALGAGKQLQPSLFFVGKDHKERVADWEVKYFPVWRGAPGKKELFLQVWVGLPPLLDIGESDGPEVSLLENSHKHKSPFVHKPEIKKVLTFETQNRLSMFGFSNKTLADKGKVKIKISFPREFSLVETAQACRNSHVTLRPESANLSPFLMSVDCISGNDFRVQIKTSSDVELDVTDRSASLEKEKNGITMLFDPSKLPRGENVKVIRFRVSKDKDVNVYNIFVKRPKKRFIRFKSSLSKVKKEDPVEEVIEPEKSLSSYDFGFYSSKAGLELLVSTKYKHESWNGYIRGRALVPTGYIVGHSGLDNYLDLTASYIYPTAIISEDRLAVGGGARVLHFLSESSAVTKANYLLSPSFSISFKDIFILSSGLPIDVSLEYSPILKGLSAEAWEGSRLLGEFNVGLLESQYGYLSLSLLYGELEVKSGSRHFSDNKFLVGGLFRW